VLVISHVLNELDEPARTELRALAARSETILWVEPGTHEVSRTLGGWRERLRGQFRAIAPCPHQATCGVLTPGNERHWCHFFAAPPAGVYADSGWVKFGQRAGIDLRSLPYSFLVLDQRGMANGKEAVPSEASAKEGFSRILGEPRHYKGYAKLFNCDESGVAELMLQKRDAPEIFKALKDPDGPMIYRWTRNGDRITSGTPRFARE
jgi:ribosomal protein RSM22 (predicted rRNA methylase)